MKAIVKEVNQLPKVVDIEDELSTFQSLVGGHIEVVSVGLGVLLVCNEEGKLNGLPANFSMGYDTIVGTAVFVANGNDGDFTSLSDEQLDFIMSKFY